MSKPWDEEWTEGDDRADGDGKPGCIYGPDDELVLSSGPGVRNRLRATLASAAPDMARALLANGYVRHNDGIWHTDCCNEQNDGGASCFESCTQARAALTKAGVLP